ncbi:hypothetical protein ACJQWK_03060 [Exserohilum turcicum]
MPFRVQDDASHHVIHAAQCFIHTHNTRPLTIVCPCSGFAFVRSLPIAPAALACHTRTHTHTYYMVHTNIHTQQQKTPGAPAPTTAQTTPLQMPTPTMAPSSLARRLDR